MAISNKTMQIEVRKLADIKPYWRNPRKNDLAVPAVKASIEQFGFNQPLVVDTKGVIIAGHTRYRALTELGYTEVNVVVSTLNATQAKQYRIADNKAGEFAEWNTDQLIQELREIGDTKGLQVFFGNENLDTMLAGVTQVKFDTPSTDQIDRLAEKMEGQFTERSDAAAKSMVMLMCPHCAEEFNLDRNELLRQPAVEG